MTEKLNPGGLPTTRRNYTPAFKAGCVDQVAADARQTDVARAQDISSALLGRWQRQALEQAVPSSAERAGIKRLRTELKRVEMARYVKKRRAHLLPAASLMSRYQVSGHCPEPWPAQVLGRMLGSSRAGYYQWRGRAQPTPAPWQAAAQAAFVRATPGATGPAACGRDCTPGAMRWGATPCARGCTSTGCGR